MEEKILVIANKKEEKFLRNKADEFDFARFSRKDVSNLLVTMKSAMRRANGVGLSANQIGLPYRVFVAQVPERKGGSRFYAIFNPTIEKTSGEKISMEEGCLSIPGTYGIVERPLRVTLRGFDRNGKPFKIKAWGLPARVFQHEVDHLEGKLFIDRTKHVYHMPRSERLKEKESHPHTK